MSAFRSNIGYTILKKHKQEEKSQSLMKLKDVSNVGIVYSAKIDRRALTKVIHYFESEGKKVNTLGFVEKKELDSNQISTYSEEYFCLKDLKFWKLPRKNSISRFTQMEFDYLINLDLKGRLELQSISTYSRAKTRIGKHFEMYPFAQDLMIKSVASTEEDLFNEIVKFIK